MTNERSRKNRVFFQFAAVLVWAMLAAGEGRADSTLAFVGATIYPSPGVPAISDGVVVVEGGLIAAVGPRDAVAVERDTELVDCSGLSLTAGFWNSHVHFTPWKLVVAGWLPRMFSDGEIREMLTRHGFVHVLDTGSLLGSTVRLRERTAGAALAGPEILIAAGSFVPKGGSPYYIRPLRNPELATTEEARAAVLRTLDDGADGIKIFTGGADSPETVVVMDLEIVRSATSAAHERGAFVVAHPSNSAGARAALEGGVDILSHTFPREYEGPWDQSLLPRMKRAGMALIPTVKLWKYELERAGRSPEAIARRIQVAQEQVREFAALDGQILFGTDVGYMSDYDPTDEYVYLSEAGLSFSQILAALTTAPASRFGASARTGRVVPGMEADLVLFEGDPESDIVSLARVRYALRGGEIVYRSR